jgi:hypothetical protein
MRHIRAMQLGFSLLTLIAGSALAADTVLYNNDFPDGKIGAASGGAGENETADDFLLSSPTQITRGSFTGLIPKGATISRVGIEIYGVETNDLNNGGSAVTRVNSPTDAGLAGTERDNGGVGGLTYFASPLNNGVGVANSVVNDINAQTPGGPAVFTGGEGGASGQEVRFNFTIDPITLGAGHYFFVPTVDLSDGSFLWLSADRPIGSFGSTPFPLGVLDLQAWTRDSTLAPDWLRIGPDIIGPAQDPATYNAAFRLVGTVVPEPAIIAMLIGGLLMVGAWSQRKLT